MTRDGVEQFLCRFIDWASHERDIVAVALVGSYARGTPTPTFDVDLVILSPASDRYPRSRDWMHIFGTVAKEQTEAYCSSTSVRVHYGDGLEVEYGWTDEAWAADPLDEGTREVIADEMRILLDCRLLLSRHLRIDEGRPTNG
jgi:hypothetical protein